MLAGFLSGHSGRVGVGVGGVGRGGQKWQFLKKQNRKSNDDKSLFSRRNFDEFCFLVGARQHQEVER